MYSFLRIMRLLRCAAFFLTALPFVPCHHSPVRFARSRADGWQHITRLLALTLDSVSHAAAAVG